MGSRFPSMGYNRMRASKQNRKLLDSGQPSCPAVCPVCSEPCVGAHDEMPEHHWDPLGHEWSDA